MKPSQAELERLCPGIDRKLVSAHLERLGDDYFEAFSPEQAAAHVQAISRLSSTHPVDVLFGESESHPHCTILAFDYPSEFSLITGILAGSGLAILSGNVFTYRPVPNPRGPASWLRRRRRRSRAELEPYERRCIIDHFVGELDETEDAASWPDRLRAHLAEVLGLLEPERAEDITRARHTVNELVARRLGHLRTDDSPVLYPVSIDVLDDESPYTTLRVVSQDTPAFLYAFSNALSLRNVSVETVRIRTVGTRVEDEIGIWDRQGRPITDRDLLDHIKLSVLLTKQFTYCLGRAPDPYAALKRFDRLADEILKKPERAEWLELFSSADALQQLAHILGTSDFLWEDFVRTQYEALRPLLRPGEGPRRSFSADALRRRLDQALSGVTDYEEARRRLNAWKDAEIVMIDIDHILHAGADVRALALPLTLLAQTVVARAVDLTYAALVARHGEPRTVGGLGARFAVFGLGKLGGGALGYASDIELLFVYSDSGGTDGAETIDNAEFFDRLTQETALSIRARREGIFRVDLRLRPYGNSGPKACSLESFCRYFGSGGDAHPFERLALTCLRAIAGDRELGEQVQRLRNEFVYAGAPLDLAALRELREKQYEEKAEAGRYNAKFGAGALVDLEYCVQILQVLHGKEHPRLCTPSIHEALDALSAVGILDAREAESLTLAYLFIRRLINGLRMLRGNALDLFLPERGTDEYSHLARRMGYEQRPGIDPEQQLLVDFQTNSAVIRTFIARHFGRDVLPGKAPGNVVDLILSEDPPEDLRVRVLSQAGFRNLDRAYLNLRKLAGESDTRERFARLSVLGLDVLGRTPDSDMALNNWERFANSLTDPGAHYALLLSQPKRLEILLGIFGGSQFLAQTLATNPEFLDWVTDASILRGKRDRATLEKDLDVFAGEADTHEEWLDAIRRFRNRENLRIGTRDMCLMVPVTDVMADLSALADTLVAAALERESRELAVAGTDPVPRGLCILAMGKLGGKELNYSSDIDLLAVYDADGDSGREPAAVYARLMERVRHALSCRTAQGHAYRVDLRLRPHGRSGELVQSTRALRAYYRDKAQLWEVQALLKARPVAGAMRVGETLLAELRHVVAAPRGRSEVAGRIRGMRQQAVQQKTSPGRTDVKSGLGGIRDVEFLVQGLQLVHAAENPGLLTGNTLEALDRLATANLLDCRDELRQDYLFLRKVEHCLQILEDRQIHAIPPDGEQLAALSRRVLGPGASTESFTARLEAAQTSVHGAYLKFVGQSGAEQGTDPALNGLTPEN